MATTPLPRVRPGDGADVVPDVLGALDEAGGVIVEDLLGADAAGRILDELADGYRATDP